MTETLISSRLRDYAKEGELQCGIPNRPDNLFLTAADEIEQLKARLEQISALACYASEENTAARSEALLEIGKLARGEETVGWPIL